MSRICTDARLAELLAIEAAMMGIVLSASGPFAGDDKWHCPWCRWPIESPQGHAHGCPVQAACEVLGLDKEAREALGEKGKP